MNKSFLQNYINNNYFDLVSFNLLFFIRHLFFAYFIFLLFITFKNGILTNFSLFFDLFKTFKILDEYIRQIYSFFEKRFENGS